MSKYLIDALTKSDKFIISAGGNGTKFGMRDLSGLGKGKNNYHIGNDYNTPTGTKLYAPTDGEFLITRRVGDASDYGNQIFFYMDGYNHTLHLAHLSDIARLEGKKINKGQYIGTTGNTGLSTGPHLHLGVAPGKKKDTLKGRFGDGTWINPSTFYLDKPVPSLSNREVAQQIKDGIGGWGDGQTRKDNLKAKGYDFNLVQPIVNELMQAKAPSSKVGQYANLIGATYLYVNPTGNDTYPIPSSRQTTSLMSRSAEVLEERNKRVRLSVPTFDNQVWVSLDQVTITRNPIYKIR